MIRFFLFLILIACTSCSQQETNIHDQKEIAEEIKSESLITCPFCGYQKVEILPLEYCLFRYNCDSCENTITPIDDDCCVFCSYGTHECPSIQEYQLQN